VLDLHCHLFPAMDDGPTSIDETLSMLYIAQEEGIETIAATHHYMEEQLTVGEYLTIWEEKHKQVQELIRMNNIELNIVSGAEVMASPFLAQLEGLKSLCINGSRYLLIELPMMDIPQYTEDVIYSLRLKGITPIIAHPERNRLIVDDPNLLHPLIEMGALGQVTTGSITGLFGKKVTKCARILLEHNMAHLISTDAHSPRRRSPRFETAVTQLEKWFGEKHTNDLIKRNPMLVLNDEAMELELPLLYRKSMFSFPSRLVLFKGRKYYQ
jgi:protein-tyrosine phosphatase